MTSSNPLATALRTHLCGALREAHVGQTVRVGGWVHRTRNLGGLVFVDLRDRAGLLQVSFAPGSATPEALQVAERLTPETVVLIEGEVVSRPAEGHNPELETGSIELRAVNARVVGPALTPAIPVARGKGEKLAAEELRLKYRILDLRRPELQQNLVMRHRLMQVTRQVMSDRGFLEIETPILTKPTPEGARDFLVPSRVHQGEFYALPQSPQIYKQLLMVAGYDRYFQIARCFRDEDLRADRQLEFTQIDLEASFVSARDVQDVVEACLVALWGEAGHAIPQPFPCLTWKEAMERFGVDKPDLRYGIEIEDLTRHVGSDAAPFVTDALGTGARMRGLRVPHGADASRKEIDGLTAAARDARAGGLIWAKRTEHGWEGQGVKAIGASALDALGGDVGELLLAVVGKDDVTSPALHAVRSLVVKRPGVPMLREHAFCWVVDFPLFEHDPETGAYVPAHHPFTSPHPDDFPFLESDPGRCRAQHYDAVYNGNELGSGSIRITDPQLQALIFRLLGIGAEEQQRRFGFLLDGLASGAPPHGGFALGFDRIAMLLAGAPSLRDVIAFPKTTAARALFEGAPTPVKPEDLVALHLAITE
ncbi:MAG: aspartate--tRNA ligase [Gemmatimonadaceae bacterium]|nr:aspartate--tRNA ligase [Gemmatimonadaceae bacterium]